jgi:deazaflavin-dependent oxidoreductase (nitroreductase family)
MTARQSVQRFVLRVHQAIYELSGGFVGHHLIGVPSLLLRTTGRRTGRVRTTALIYARDGAGYVLVASNHGLGRDPAWLLNIRADPTVEIQVGRRRERRLGRVVEKNDPPTTGGSGSWSTRATTTATRGTRPRAADRSRSLSCPQPCRRRLCRPPPLSERAAARSRPHGASRCATIRSPDRRSGSGPGCRSGEVRASRAED